MTTNSQLLITEPKTKTKTKQTTRTGTEPQKWKSHGGLSVGGGGRRLREQVQGIRNINCRYEIDGEVKNGMGNGEAKELICMTHGHELRWGNAGGREDTGQRRIKGRKKMRQL